MILRKTTIALMSRKWITSHQGFTILLILSKFLCIQRMSDAVDSINTTQSITDGETLISSGGGFELGFFSLDNSDNRYVGMWYRKITIRTVVWVANRDKPLTTASGVLRIIKPGLLVLFNGTGHTVWSSNSSRSVQDPVAQLLDSGNLVVRDANDVNSENFLWQSFNYPTDTLLPGMKLGKNFVTGLEVFLSSWKSTNNPARGDYTFHCDPSGYPQNILRKGSTDLFRAGPWNGLRFSGLPGLIKNLVYTFQLVVTNQEVYYRYDLLNSSIISRFMVTQSGLAQRLIWVEQMQVWQVYLSSPTDNCDNYNKCGSYGSCSAGGNPPCECLNKFKPRIPEEWSVADWSSGCVRNMPLECHSGEGFLKYPGVKLPDTKNSSYNENMTIKECEIACMENCSCMAYATLDIKTGRGCLLWFDPDLRDIRELQENGQDIYIRMASSELESQSVLKGRRRKILIVSLSSVLGVILLGLSIVLYIRKERKKHQGTRKKGDPGQTEKDYGNGTENEDLELPFFNLLALNKATNDFSGNNKLGEGGFGVVYKGKLEGGQEVAVKRLSKTSTQGIDEFKNEVICIAKLQHRNLVRLLGCCIQEEEKMLIYEYMPNKSLDSYIFDQSNSILLDWTRRFHIINGIARGLLYLHQDSRLRVIHRDLKASNVLLDKEMNPKISDFGLARCFRGDETAANTSRVVGTYGYMSPEYVVDGLFSVKSDVFSFGVLVLEIVSSKRNRGFNHPDHRLNLLGHAWQLQREGRPLDLVDIHLVESCHLSEVLRSIQVALLCVQQCPEDRPSMSSVVLMLANEGLPLPQAKEPGFYMKRTAAITESSASTQPSSSMNDISITLVDGR